MTNDHDIRTGVHKIRTGSQERANKKKDKILKVIKNKLSADELNLYTKLKWNLSIDEMEVRINMIENPNR